jgi:2'-5' RNA ligase
MMVWARKVKEAAQEGRHDGKRRRPGRGDAYRSRAAAGAAMSVRLFAALDVPGEVAAALARLQRGVGGARWSPRENLHVTLRFFGDVPEPQADDLDAALREAALRRRAFEIRLKGAGFFGGAAPHALYIAVAPNEALAALAADCERAARRAGLPPETRKYVPHVTLAYLNRPDLARVIAFERNNALFETPPWRVEQFGLYSSVVRNAAPSLYRLEADYALL